MELFHDVSREFAPDAVLASPTGAGVPGRDIPEVGMFDWPIGWICLVVERADALPRKRSASRRNL
jgi:hypothetical protein